MAPGPATVRDHARGEYATAGAAPTIQRERDRGRLRVAARQRRRALSRALRARRAALHPSARSARSACSTSRLGSPAPTAASCSRTRAPRSSRSKPAPAIRSAGGRRRASDLGGEDGPFFQFLHFSKRSVLVAPGAPAVAAAIATRIWSSRGPVGGLDAAAVARDVRIWCCCRSRPTAASGPVGGASGDGVHAAGRERIHRRPRLARAASRSRPADERRVPGGSFAAAAALAALRRARRSGHGEQIDVSLLEAMALGYDELLSICSSCSAVRRRSRRHAGDRRNAVDRADGGRLRRLLHQHRPAVLGFSLLIERPDLRKTRASPGRRADARFGEWQTSSASGRTRHTTDEIVELAPALRIPVAPVLDGDSVRRHPHGRGTRRLPARRPTAASSPSAPGRIASTAGARCPIGARAATRASTGRIAARHASVRTAAGEGRPRSPGCACSTSRTGGPARRRRRSSGPARRRGDPHRVAAETGRQPHGRRDARRQVRPLVGVQPVLSAPPTRARRA